MPGGVNKSLTIAERDELPQGHLPHHPVVARGGTADPEGVAHAGSGLYNSLVSPSNFMSRVGHNGDLDFYHGTPRPR